jgi:hypothetical protein
VSTRPSRNVCGIAIPSGIPAFMLDLLARRARRRL